MCVKRMKQVIKFEVLFFKDGSNIQILELYQVLKVKKGIGNLFNCFFCNEKMIVLNCKIVQNNKNVDF